MKSRSVHSHVCVYLASTAIHLVYGGCVAWSTRLLQARIDDVNLKVARKVVKFCTSKGDVVRENSQLLRDILHQGRGRPWLLEEVVERVHCAVHQVLFLVVHLGHDGTTEGVVVD